MEDMITSDKVQQKKNISGELEPFSDTLYGRLEKRIWVFSEEIPYGVG